MFFHTLHISLSLSLSAGRERALAGTQDGGVGAMATTGVRAASWPVEVAVVTHLRGHHTLIFSTEYDHFV